MAHTPHPDGQVPLRVWPGIAAAIAMVAIQAGALLIGSGLGAIGLLAGAAGVVAIATWWLLFSRAPWLDRLAAPAVMGLVVIAVSPVVDRSIANGFMGKMLPIFGIPLMSVALVAWATVRGRLSPAFRRPAMCLALVLAGSAMTLVRTGGITGDGDTDLHWRWTETPEERLLARVTNDAPLAPLATTTPPPTALPTLAPEAAREAPRPVEDSPATPPTSRETVATAGGPVAGDGVDRVDWPGFRGPDRDSVIRGVRIATDWSAHPPVELWRRAVGPGWSSFAVQGDRLYTQEQRGEDEIVACYRVSTGEPVWQHRDRVRFWESNGGAGPRATPTLHGGRVFTMGATGRLNALDAITGAALWSRDAATDTGKAIPDWGLASSPVVVDDLVIVAVSGQLAAYDIGSGVPRWMGEPGGGGYSSPHLATIDGVPQVLLVRGSRTISVAPADGTLLWEHAWQPSASIVQPSVAPDGTVLVTSADAMGGQGMRRIAVAHRGATWSVEERWTSRGLKPYFNDFVVHDGHVFGFDGSILAAVSLADGARAWKGGRYGHGQLALLADQGVLLVLSEDGELALVKASADAFAEIARFRVLEGKTWNHPVLVGDVVLVRNGEEMAAFRLARDAAAPRGALQ